MKMFNKYVSLLFFMMHGVMYAHADTPSSIIAAYQNKIVAADFSYDKQEDSLLTVTLELEKAPICVYYPASYKESKDSMTKRFFLPRTDWAHKKMKDFMHDLQSACAPLGIDCQCHQLKKDRFGLEMIFSIKSSQYDIKKVIDMQNNLVLFQINVKK